MSTEYVLMMVGVIAVALVLSLIDAATVRMWDDHDQQDGDA